MLDKAADEVLERLANVPKGMWIILLDGVRVTTRTRKSSWASIGAAKNALRNEFCKPLYRMSRDMSYAEIEEAWQDFLKRRVEFLEVD